MMIEEKGEEKKDNLPICVKCAEITEMGRLITQGDGAI
jgi:hypothetical protein